MIILKQSTKKVSNEYHYILCILQIQPDSTSNQIQRRLYVTLAETFDNNSLIRLPLYFVCYGIKNALKNDLDMTIYDYNKPYEIVNETMKMHIPIDTNGFDILKTSHYLHGYEYACPVWHSSLKSSLHNDLEQIQRCATKIMLPSLSYNERLSELGLPTLHERRVELCRRFYKSVVRQHKFHDVLPSTVERPYSLRNPRTFSLVKCRTKRFQDSFIPYAVKSWDASP